MTGNSFSVPNLNPGTSDDVVPGRLTVELLRRLGFACREQQAIGVLGGIALVIRP